MHQSFSSYHFKAERFSLRRFNEHEIGFRFWFMSSCVWQFVCSVKSKRIFHPISYRVEKFDLLCTSRAFFRMQTGINFRLHNKYRISLSTNFFRRYLIKKCASNMLTHLFVFIGTWVLIEFRFFWDIKISSPNPIGRNDIFTFNNQQN